MLKLARTFFTNSPVELLALIPTSSNSGGRFQLDWRHSTNRFGASHQQKCFCNSGSAGPICASSPPLHKSESNNEQIEKQDEEWPPVKLARCGIAKEQSGAATANFFETSQTSNVHGDDASFIATFGSVYAAGVADGVGGWRQHGVDPSKFSSQLMANCAEIVQKGHFQTERPDLIISRAYYKLKQKVVKTVGSSTACVLVVSKRTLYAANLGDSGYMICREGQVIFRSSEQTHYFNAPYQLAILPERFGSPNYKGKANFLGNKPESTELREHALQPGDLILTATDGLWDNIPDDKIAQLLRGTQSTEDSLQARCNALALIARHMATDALYESPFTKKARENGINAPGGKPDDVTIVVFHVS